MIVSDINSAMLEEGKKRATQLGGFSSGIRDRLAYCDLMFV